MRETIFFFFFSLMWSLENLLRFWVEVQNVTNFHFPSVTGTAQLVVLATRHNSLTVLLPCATPGSASPLHHFPESFNPADLLPAGKMWPSVCPGFG